MIDSKNHWLGTNRTTSEIRFQIIEPAIEELTPYPLAHAPMIMIGLDLLDLDVHSRCNHIKIAVFEFSYNGRASLYTSP